MLQLLFELTGSNYLFIFVAVPIIGPFTKKWRFRQVKFPLMIGSILFILPLFFGYILFFVFAHYLFIFLVLTWLYGQIKLSFIKLEYRIILHTLISGSIFISFAIASFMQSFSGYNEVTQKQQKGQYEIHYIKSQGFAGSHHLKIYELRHRIFNGLYSKKLDQKSISSNDTTGRCLFYYPEYTITYDRCKNEISTKNL